MTATSPLSPSSCVGKEAKHTPGPWEFDPATGRIDAVALRKPTGCMLERDDGTKHDYIGGLVALPYACRSDEDYATGVGSAEANARLMAAAPDLLEAAECAANVLFLLDEEVGALGHKADNVVAKLRSAIAKAGGAQ